MPIYRRQGIFAQKFKIAEKDAQSAPDSGLRGKRTESDYDIIAILRANYIAAA